jgi:hypothetical protein
MGVISNSQRATDYTVKFVSSYQLFADTFYWYTKVIKLPIINSDTIWRS